MPNPPTKANPEGRRSLLQSQKMRNGGPKTGHRPSKPLSGNASKKISPRSGDVVSDESDDGGDEGANSADDDEEAEADKTDAFALSSAHYSGSKAAARLAGLKAQDVEMDDAEAVAAATNFVEDESDDDYAAVEDISDIESMGDDDEHNVLRSAEKDLIAEFERTERPRQTKAMTDELGDMCLKEDAAATRRLSLQSQDSLMDDLDLGLDFDADPFGGLQASDSLYQELIEESEVAFDNDMLSSWRNPDADSSHENSMPFNGQKKVRFEEALSSRASSVSSDEDAQQSFPDLFDGHDDSLSRQLILSGMDIDAFDNESEYEFEDEDKALKVEATDTDMSDTDSDEGDTTDEESPEEQLARVKAYRAARDAKDKADGNESIDAKSEPRTPATAQRSTPPSRRERSTAARSATPNSSNRPRTGTFNVSLSHASVTADIRGSGIKVVCPKKPPAKDRAYWERARQAIGSRDGSPGGSIAWTPSIQQAPSIPKRPFTAKSTLGTMFDGNLDFLRNHDENGIAKEFLRFARKGSVQSSYTSNTMTSEVSDSATNVNMHDFVCMDDSDSDNDEPSLGAIISPTQDHFSDNFMSSSVASRDPGNGLLDHLDQQRGLVSSFRNNQNHARHVSSLPANPASRAQISEANALQKGKRSAANAPITPARKKRQSQDLESTGAGIRKLASPLAQKHRRSRGNSLSGIHQTLASDFLASTMK